MEQAGRIKRRGFLGAIAATGLAQLANPANSSGTHIPGRTRIGFDNFSVRAFDWKAPRLIQYAASLKVDTLLLSDMEVYETLDPSYLAQLQKQAARSRVELQAGTGSICPTSKAYNEQKWGKAEDHARALIQTAKGIGANVARCYLGTRRDRDGDGGIYRHIEEMVKTLKAVRNEAEDANVTIAIENHAGDMQAWELVELIEAAGKSFVGATMDPGNGAWTLEDPMANLELLGPYVATTGIRDTAVWETDKGAKCMWANMGHGNTDWKPYVKRFQELCPNAPFVLEIISYKWGTELEYLVPEFWSRFPRARAHEFAQFVALAKKGVEFQLPPNRPTGEQSPELEQAQQKFDLEESIKYCKTVLGLGQKA